MDYLGSLTEDSQFLDVEHLPNVTSSDPPSLDDALCNLWLLATWLKPGIFRYLPGSWKDHQPLSTKL